MVGCYVVIFVANKLVIECCLFLRFCCEFFLQKYVLSPPNINLHSTVQSTFGQYKGVVVYIMSWKQNTISTMLFD